MYDLATGVCRVPGHGARVPVYPTGVEDGKVWVELP
jgi:nitrite reductase/ring-hydroxylating ferredoxin subunit